MLQRSIRERKEYLYAKSVKNEDNEVLNAKIRIKKRRDEGKPLSSKDREFEFKNRDKLDLDDSRILSRNNVSSIDDEYANAGSKDPKILMTTSHNPSSRLISFLKELSFIFPGSFRINRGSYSCGDLVSIARRNEVSDIVVVHEHRGIPDGLIVSHFPFGPTAYFALAEVLLRHDLPEKPPHMSLVSPHLIFDNFTTPLGARVMKILKFLYPPAAPTSSRIMAFVNKNDEIFFRHYMSYKASRTAHGFEKPKAVNTAETIPDAQQLRNRKQLRHIELREIGPRFTLKPYRIELGLIDMKDLEVEWMLRPFINKAKNVL